MTKIYNAALIIIGDEILSGRTKDKNINHIANKLAQSGIDLVEVRVVADDEGAIIRAVQALKDEVSYVFTTGGIGPTHDDITCQSVARALGVELEENEQAFAMLESHYGAENFTKARRKMATLPLGAELIPNSVSVAPGFVIDNVYVMAGVPRIMEVMMDYVVQVIEGGEIILSDTVSFDVPESFIAEALEVVQNKFEEKVSIGSYPYFEEGVLGVNVVLRSKSKERLAQALGEVEEIFSSI